MATKSERQIQDEIRLEVSKQCPGIILRTNAGQAWAGERVWSNEFNGYVIVNPRPVKLLVKGFSDLLYLGPDGTAFIECKDDKGRPREEQIKFINLMRTYGYKAGIARSVEDALQIIQGGTRDDATLKPKGDHQHERQENNLVAGSQTDNPRCV